MHRQSDTGNFGTAIIASAVIVAITVLFLVLNHYLFHFDWLPSLDELFGIHHPITDDVGDDEVQVHFIDVGQGDSELILTKDKAVLIDSGENESAGKLYQYLKALDINKLDYIICTHPHSDHIGGMHEIINRIETDTVIMPYLPDKMIPVTSSYSKLLKSISDRNVKAEYAEFGTELVLGDECVLKIYAPQGEYDNLNNYSVVCRLEHYDNSFLFTGDIEKTVEYELLDSDAELKSTVIKVPHHGSSSSSSYKFLKEVRPQYAVFEVGAANDYGHPHREIYDRYGDFDCIRLRTDYSGSIVFTSRNGNIDYVPEKGKKL